MQVLTAHRNGKAVVPIFFMLLASACSNPEEVEAPTVWKGSYSAAECRQLMDFEAAIERCGHGDVNLLGNVIETDPSICIPYSKPQRMTGVWLAGFEFSAFYEGAHDYDDVLQIEGEVLDGDVWFRDDGIDQPPAIEPPNGTNLHTLAAYYVEILGRKSLCGGAYGHLGGSSYEVLPTQVMVIRPIPAWAADVRSD